MKRFKVIFVSGLAMMASIFIACQPKAVNQIEGYNAELEKVQPDSVSAEEISEISKKFSKGNGFDGFTRSDFKQVEKSQEFESVLEREKKLLDEWVPVKGFADYSTRRPDTLLKLIRRCSTFDRGGADKLRMPAYRMPGALSLLYYKFEIPVAFHIVTRTDGTGMLQGMNEKIQDQVNLLNAVYSGYNVTFKLLSIDRVVNNFWHDGASYYQSQTALNQMTNSMSVQPDRVMNVYTVGSGVLGEATYPDEKTNGTSSDYVLINFNTLPGGPVSFQNGLYTQGKTLVHEAGHYMGLYHTFEGGSYDCQSAANMGCEPGDLVDDTPAQKICYFRGCELGEDGRERDSCPSPGKDPVKNYMGYNPDACMSELSPGQVERIIRTLFTFRSYFKKEVV